MESGNGRRHGTRETWEDSDCASLWAADTAVRKQTEPCFSNVTSVCTLQYGRCVVLMAVIIIIIIIIIIRTYRTWHLVVW